MVSSYSNDPLFGERCMDGILLVIQTYDGKNWIEIEHDEIIIDFKRLLRLWISQGQQK